MTANFWRIILHDLQLWVEAVYETLNEEFNKLTISVFVQNSRNSVDVDWTGERVIESGGAARHKVGVFYVELR